MEYSLARNKLVHLVELRAAAVDEAGGRRVTVVAPQRGIWGTASVGGANIDTSVDNEGDYGRVRLGGAVQGASGCCCCTQMCWLHA